MKNRKFSEFIKEEKGEKYFEELLKEKPQSEKCIYVKDNEGFAAKKPENQVSAEDIIITEQEYNELVGNAIKQYTRGGARKGAGRKKIFKASQKATFEFEKDTLIQFKAYAKKQNKSQNELINEAVKKIING